MKTQLNDNEHDINTRSCLDIFAASTIFIVAGTVYVAICLNSKVPHAIKTLIYSDVEKSEYIHLAFQLFPYVRKYEIQILFRRWKLYGIAVKVIFNCKKKILIPFILLYFHATGCEIYDMGFGAYYIQNRAV